VATSAAGAAPTAKGKAAPVSFSKQVAPLFKTNCAGCHNSKMPQGGLSLETLALAMKGGTHGLAILPGKSKASRLIEMVSGPMPKRRPGTGLKGEQGTLLAAWSDRGARGDGTATAAGGAPERVVVNVPKIPLKVPMLPQAASLAFSKDGKWVAAGLYREVK